MADGMSKVTERIGERRFDALFLFYTFLTALVLTVVLAFLEQQRTRRKIGKMDFLSGVASDFQTIFQPRCCWRVCRDAGVYRVSEL